MEKLKVFNVLSSGCCNFCGSKTNLACHRCGDFYCTVKCQLSDWQRHRYICFPVPPLVNPRECSAYCCLEELIEPSQQVVEEGVIEHPVSTVSIKVNENEDGSKAQLEEKKEEISPLPMPAVAADEENADKCENNKNTDETVTTPAIAYRPSVSSNNRTWIKKSAKNYAPPNEQPAKTEELYAFPPAAAAADKKNISQSESSYHPDVKEIAIANPPSINLNRSTSTQEYMQFISPRRARLPLYGSVVYVSSFLASNRCFLREASEISEWVHSTNAEKIDVLARYQPIAVNLKVSDYALAKHDGHFYRVKVLTLLDTENMRLQYLDLGCVKLRNGAEMRTITQEILNFPCLFVEIQLKGVPKYKSSTELKLFLEKLTGHQYIINYCQFKFYELVNVESRMLLNGQILKNCENMIVVKPPRKTPTKEGSNHSNEPKYKDYEPKIPLLKSPTNIPIESKSDFNYQRSQPEPKGSKFLKAIEFDSSQKQKPVAYDETLDKELTKLSVKPKETVRSDYVAAKPIPTVNLEYKETPNVENNVKTNIRTEIKAVETEPKPEVPKPEEPKPEVPKPEEPKPGVGEKQPKTVNKPRNEHVLLQPFVTRPITINSENGIDVFIADNTNISRGIFGGFDSVYAQEFSELQQRLSGFNDTQRYRPIVREYVIAKFEGAWHRGRVVEIKSHRMYCTYDVMFVEFANVINVKAEDIRRYPDDLTIPCNSSICLLEGFPHRPTKAQLNYLQENLQKHNLLHVDSVNYLQDMALLTCNALIEALIKLR